jgi:hypothetical protein
VCVCVCVCVEAAPMCGTVITLKHWKSDFTLMESSGELCADAAALYTERDHVY